MMEKHELQKIENDTLKLLFFNGTEDISIGMKLIFVGLTVVLIELNTIFFFLIFILPSTTKMIDWIRNKYVIPRMGFAKVDYSHFQSDLKRTILTLLVGFITIIILLVMETYFSYQFNYISLVPLAFGIIIVMIFNFQYQYTKFKRYWGYGGISFLIGLIVTSIMLTSNIREFWGLGTSVIFLLPGIVAIVFGLIRLMQFVNNNKIIEEGDE